MMQRIAQKAWLLIPTLALLSGLVGLLANPAAGVFSHLSPWVALVLFSGGTLLVALLTSWQAQRQSASDMPEEVARKNRQTMLGRVKTRWITGFLENELHYDELISLSLRARTSRSGSPLQNPFVHMQTLPLGTTIKEVFDQARGRLLILGEAGTGKTILLLELARDLLQQAKNNEDAPIPVVLTLASWAVKQLPLEQWVVEELRTKYDIYPQVGKVWVETSQLLLLLDGFDEVAPSAQPACIKAVSTYAAKANRSLVICSRTKEYLDQPGRFSSLHTVVSIQPLSPQQIEEYLSSWGEDTLRLKQALYQSEALRALVVTPFLLKVLILAYCDKSEEEVLALVETTPADQLHRLFHDYAEQMLRQAGTRMHATAQQTKQWLTWLAAQLTKHQQTELYLEYLQPSWLSEKQISSYRWSLALLGGLFFGLTLGLFFGLIAGLLGGSILGFILGLLFEAHERMISRDRLIGMLIGGLIGVSANYNFSGQPLFGLISLPLLGLIWGTIVGWYIGPTARQIGDRIIGAPSQTVRGLSVWLLSNVSVGLLSGLIVVVGQLGGWDVSLAEGLTIFLGVTLLSGLIAGMLSSLIVGVRSAPASSLITGLLSSLIVAWLSGMILPVIWLVGERYVGLFSVLILGLSAGLLGGFIVGGRSDRILRFLSGRVVGLINILVRGLLIGLISGLVIGLYIGLYEVVYFWRRGELSTTLFGSLVAELLSCLITGLFIGMVVGWIGGPALELIGRDRLLSLVDRIRPTEVITWLRASAWKKMVDGLVGGLILGLVMLAVVIFETGVSWSDVVAVVEDLFGQFGPINTLLYGTAVLVFPGLVGAMLGGLLGGFSKKQLTGRIHLAPNEAIWRSAKNGLIFGLLFGLGVGLLGVLGGYFGVYGYQGFVIDWLFFGGLLALFSSPIFGLFAFVQHFTLRFWLWQAKCTPVLWLYVPFLDDAVDRQLLRRIGGGYVFRHRLLQDYFASLATNGLPATRTG